MQGLLASVLFLVAIHINVFASDSDHNNSRNEFLNRFVDYYNKDLNDYIKMIFVSADRGGIYKSPDNKIVLIYNQDAYDKELDGERIEGLPQEGVTPRGNVVKIGNSLVLNEKSPIGYNIMLPLNKPVKAVMVEVYGGMGRARKYQMFKPGQRGELEKYLIDKGIAVIYLNLVDLLKLEVHQSTMPENLYHEIQSSINYFFTTLKNNPEVLHEDLAVLEGKNIYLFGASFGGALCLRHAELYPDTFAGYISHDGGLSYEVHEKIENIGKTKIGEVESQWLSPMTEPLGQGQQDEKISRIKQPVLVLHNLDDNRVHVKVSLSWYKRAVRMGKGNLVQLYVTKVGNPVPSELGMKGHFVPTDQEAFENYAKAVESFILDGPSKLPALSQWRAASTKIEAGKYDHTASVEEKFLSRAYDLYFESQKRGGPAALLLDGDKQEEAWKGFYLPILYSLAYLDLLKQNEGRLHEEFNYLNDDYILTQERLQNGLRYQLPLFLEYLQERYKFQIPQDMTIDELINNPNLLVAYKIYLTDSNKYEAGWDIDTRAATEVLSSLYFGNLGDLNKGLIQSAPFQEEVKSWQPKLEDLKHKLISKINQEKQNAISVWKQAVQQVRQKNNS